MAASSRSLRVWAWRCRQAEERCRQATAALYPTLSGIGTYMWQDRGALVDTFGLYADPRLGEFLHKVKIHEEA